MRLTRRIAALVLCVLMVAASFPAVIFASETTAQSTLESTTTVSETLHEQLSFDDLAVGTSPDADYFNDRLQGMDWRTVTGYEASRLVAVRDPADSANTVLAPADSYTHGSLVLNDTHSLIYNNTVDLSFRVYFTAHAGQAQIAMFRVMTSGGSQVNPLVINTEKKDTVTDNGTVFGTLSVAKSSVTNVQDSGVPVYYNTWHEIRVRYTAMTGAVELYLDGSLAMTGSSGAVDSVAYVFINRSFSGNYITNYIDDVKLTRVTEPTLAVDAFNDFNDLAFTPDTENATSGTLSGGLPEMDGFDTKFSSQVCTVVKDGEDQYISLPSGSDDLSWKYIDSNNALYTGDFEISMEFMFDGELSGTSGVISLLENTSSTSHTEMRILQASKTSMYFGPSTSYHLFALTTGTWYRISVVVRPSDETYDIYLNDELVAYTEWRDAETYVLYTHKNGAWSETLNPTWSDSGKRVPYGEYDIGTYGIYGINLFHYGTGNFSFDDLRVRSMADAQVSAVSEPTSELYNVDLADLLPGEASACCWSAASPAGLSALRVKGSVVRKAVGDSVSKVFTDNEKQAAVCLALGDGSYSYLDGGTLWVEGTVSFALGGASSDTFTFAALDCYNEDARSKSTVPLVTVSGTGAVSLLGTATGKTLTADTAYTLKVGVNSMTKTVELYMDGGDEAVATAALTDPETEMMRLSERIDLADGKSLDALTLFATDSMSFAVSAVRVYCIDLLTAEILGVQQGNDSSQIRILAGVDSLDYSKVGFTFELLSSDGRTWEHKAIKSTDTVFTSVQAAGEPVTAEELGCRYIVPVVVTDIGSDVDNILCVRPFTVQDGVKTYGTQAIYSVRSSDGGLNVELTDITTSSGYTLLGEEGFEEAAAQYSEYTVSAISDDVTVDMVYELLTDSTKHYKLGGQLNTGAIEIGASNADARSGENALVFSNIKETTSKGETVFGGRVKLSGLLPNQLTDYIGKTIRISGYVKMVDYKRIETVTTGDTTSYNVEDRTDPITISFGVMGDKTYAMYGTSYTITEGEWVYVEHVFNVTDALLGGSDFSMGDDAFTKHYPVRPYISFGETSGFASKVYFDDFKVEYKDSFGVTLPSIFADGMVLQRNKTVPIWGWDGIPGDVIRATIGDHSAEATVDASGELYLELPEMEGAYAQTLTLTNTTRNDASVSYTGVGIGEVWYCSGQSNMQLTVSKVHNVDDIIKNADNYDVRSFKMGTVATYELQRDVKNGKWKKITSSNVSGVSAIGYITAYQLQEQLDVPVAIIECYNGGSAAQPWLSYEAIFAADRADIYNNADWIPVGSNGNLVLNSSGCEGRTIWEDYDYYWSIGEIYETTKTAGTLIEGSQGSIGNRFAPTGLYNGMQGPLANYALAGVMWYQGEARANSFKPEQYNYLLHDLIEQWRRDFRDEDLPVVVIQLAPYSVGEARWYDMRQVQLDTAKRMDNVYAVTTAYEGALRDENGKCIDLDVDTNGNANAIHPGTKVPVANRVFHAAMNGVYGASYEYSGPEYDYMTVEGNKVILSFTHLADGLQIRSGDEALTGFEISEDGVNFVDAVATIVGNTVEVTADSITAPVAVRYAYVNNVVNKGTTDTLGGNLENTIGEPAFPFMATLSDVSIYGISTVAGQLTVEIRELGHLRTSNKVVIKVNDTENEYTAAFATAGNFVIDGLNVTAGDTVTVTLKNADGTSVIEEKTVTVQ